MKLLFKLYLLGQLIALPFMVGAIGNVLNSDDGSAPTISAPSASIAEANVRTLSNEELCDALHGPVTNSIQDDIQQLRFITSELYGEELVEDCFSTGHQ